MARNCEVCQLPRMIKAGADDRLARGEPLEQIARDVRVSVFALANHRRQGHTKNLPMVVVGTPDSYHGDLDFIHRELMNLYADFSSDNEKVASKRDAMLCLKEAAKVIEAKAKLAGAYNNRPDALDPRFQRLKELFSQFVVAHPEVKEDVLLMLDKAQFGDEGTG